MLEIDVHPLVLLWHFAVIIWENVVKGNLENLVKKGWQQATIFKKYETLITGLGK